MAVTALLTMEAAATAPHSRSAGALAKLPRPATTHELASGPMPTTQAAYSSSTVDQAATCSEDAATSCSSSMGVLERLVQPVHGQQAPVLSSIQDLAGAVAAQLLEPSDAGRDTITQQVGSALHYSIASLSVLEAMHACRRCRKRIEQITSSSTCLLSNCCCCHLSSVVITGPARGAGVAGHRASIAAPPQRTA